jgi:hypothetical protein
MSLSGCSLVPLKNGSAYRELVTHAFCFSHCKNIVSVQTKFEGKCAWSDESMHIQELRYILWSCINKLYIQLVYSYFTQVKSQSKAKRTAFKQFN